MAFGDTERWRVTSAENAGRRLRRGPDRGSPRVWAAAPVASLSAQRMIEGRCRIAGDFLSALGLCSKRISGACVVEATFLIDAGGVRTLSRRDLRAGQEFAQGSCEMGQEAEECGHRSHDIRGRPS